MSQLKSKLPKKKSAELDAFLNGTETTTTYPWQADHIRADVTKMYNLRLSEPYLLKLKYIAEHTPDSMQKFCLSVLEKAIDDKINELTS